MSFKPQRGAEVCGNVGASSSVAWNVAKNSEGEEGLRKTRNCESTAASSRQNQGVPIDNLHDTPPVESIACGCVCCFLLGQAQRFVSMSSKRIEA
mmetsp:Transcript_8724/g.18591  ORF Transcript_8724/g.18591 Transcript_8724/m.18591 type:complete len:95 (-) Transcript_8724:68-352(-)